MKVEKNKVVTLTYTLRFDDENGEIVQKVDVDKPFVHLFGVGGLLPAFEANLANLVADNEFAFKLPKAEAYGEVSKDDIVELSKDIFKNEEGVLDTEILQVGKLVPMQNDDGHVIQGIIMAINEEGVVMDFNHPLAGKDLYFSGKIISVREASEEEASHGHVHGPEGHQH